MKRRTPRGRSERSLPTPTRTRKPEWNAYLTDDKQYKLSQQQQLQRALQQLSAAHFAARSPAASASRRRLKAASTHSSAWSTPQDVHKGRRRATRLVDVADSGELQTARKLQFADVSLDMEEPTPLRAAGVSFQLQEPEDEDRMDPETKAGLQGELEVLEQMLWELETETERLDRQTPQKSEMRKSPSLKRTEAGKTVAQRFEPDEVEVEEQEQEMEFDHDAGEEQGEEVEEEEVEARLGDVCYKSLEIGLELARKMDSMKKELENERRLRADRDFKIEMLEQEVRSTQAKCNYLEAKYQSVASQVDGMREAVVATEEAIHRMTLAFEFSQRRRGRTSNPATPSKPAAPQPLHPNNAPKVSKRAPTPTKAKAATPKKSSKHVDQQEETWAPNGQRHH